MATSAAQLTAVSAARTAAGTPRRSDALYAVGAAMLAAAALVRGRTRPAAALAGISILSPASIPHHPESSP